MVSGRQQSSRRRASRSRPAAGKKTSALDQVRNGVRRFILSDASIGDFHKALRSAGKEGNLSPHPLTGATLRRIVKEVIDERKRAAGKRRQR